MSNKMKLSIIFTCLVLIFLVTPVNSFATTNIPISPALVTIFNQAETTYMGTLGITKQAAVDKYPDIFAVLVGMTLQRQFKYLRSNPAYVSRFKVLRDESLSFLEQLAMVHNYRNPNGSDLSKETIRTKFYDGLNGNSNIYFINKYGLDPANVGLPFMLSQVPAPKNTDGDHTEHGKLHVKKKNEINLFGQKAPPAESDSPYVGWPPKKQTSQPEPKVQKQPISRGAIVGRWQFTSFDCWSSISDDKYNVLDFRRGSGKNLYIGKSSPGDNTFIIVAETQKNQYTIEYTAFWKGTNPSSHYARGLCNKILITVCRNEKNDITLCRDGCGSIVASGYIKTDR